MTYNNIYFRWDFIENKLKPLLPLEYINFWEIDFNTKEGGIRIDKNKIKTIYLFTPIKNYPGGVLRFDKYALNWEFHSLYTNYDFTNQNKYSEYRYNLKNKLLSTYQFLGEKDKEYPFHQYVDDKLTKKYKFETAITPPIELQTAIDEGILTEFDINTIKMDKCSIKDNPNQNYYYVR
jgi:hypothetical protein